MARIKPFRSIRPEKSVVYKVAALPYDVYNRQEALEVVRKENLSFLSIDRPETFFDDSVDMYDDRVYEKAKEVLNQRIDEGIFIQDEKEYYYLYELTMNGKCQTGLVACVAIDDYLNGVVKKHENTVAAKEADRIRHVDICSAQTGPIFLAYREQKIIDDCIVEVKKNPPLYDFESADGVNHRVWRVEDDASLELLTKEFSKMNSIYIADGHHRAASAVKAGLKRREENFDFTGDEEFNYFLAVLFPGNQLNILDYNRVVKDLNHLTKEDFLKKVEKNFLIGEPKAEPFKPQKKGEIGMFLEEKWYSLSVRNEVLSRDVVMNLDVSLLQKHILGPILGIEDPRTDKRIDFVGGIRGLEELEKRCREDMKIAFSMFPTKIDELFAVSDEKKLMPPKSTWFEPKLRSGIFIHQI